MGISFFGSSGGGGPGGIRKVADATAMNALSPTQGDFVVQLDTDDMYYYNGSAWKLYQEDVDNADIDQLQNDLTAHVGDTTDAHAASAIGFTPANTIDATDVQAALEEVESDAQAAQGTANTAVANAATAQAAADAAQAGIDAHEAQTSSAHAASAIDYTAGGSISATNVQDAITEVASEAGARLATLENDTHVAVSLGPFGSTPNADGLTLSGAGNQVLNMEPADLTHPGGVTTSTQAFGGTKQFPSGATIGTSNPLPISVLFYVASTSAGAIPMPVMTTAQRTAIATPATGLQVYDSDLKGPMFYDGALWQPMDGRSVVAAAQTPADAATLTPLGYRNQILPVSGSGGAAVSLADLATTNAKDGDTLLIIGTSDTATVTVVAATNTSVNGSCTLGLDNTLMLRFYSSKWRETGRNA